MMWVIESGAQDVAKKQKKGPPRESGRAQRPRRQKPLQGMSRRFRLLADRGRRSATARAGIVVVDDHTMDDGEFLRRSSTVEHLTVLPTLPGDETGRHQTVPPEPRTNDGRLLVVWQGSNRK